MFRSAFNLIELLVVISIIAILAAILLPTIGMVRSSAQAVKCSNGLRQAALAGESYTQNWEGLLAPTKITEWATDNWWHYLLASYLEADDVISDPNNTRQVLRGCPLWKDSEAWTKFAANTSYWSCGYGQTVFVRDYNPSWPGPGNLNTDYGPVTASRMMVTGLSTRPWFADSVDFFLWAPWLSLPWADNPARIRAMERHRGRAMVAYFDGHTGKSTQLEMSLDQQSW